MNFQIVYYSTSTISQLRIKEPTTKIAQLWKQERQDTDFDPLYPNFH